MITRTEVRSKDDFKMWTTDGTQRRAKVRSKDDFKIEILTESGGGLEVRSKRDLKCKYFYTRKPRSV